MKEGDQGPSGQELGVTSARARRVSMLWEFISCTEAQARPDSPWQCARQGPEALAGRKPGTWADMGCRGVIC
jgi:hypothetical protein